MTREELLETYRIECERCSKNALYYCSGCGEHLCEDHFEGIEVYKMCPIDYDDRANWIWQEDGIYNCGKTVEEHDIDYLVCSTECLDI